MAASSSRNFSARFAGFNVGTPGMITSSVRDP